DRIRDGISIGRQKTTQSIITYSEIIGLPDIQCFLRLPSNYPIVKLHLKFEKRQAIAPHFLPIKQNALFEATSDTAEDNNINEEIFDSQKKRKKEEKQRIKIEPDNEGI